MRKVLSFVLVLSLVLGSFSMAFAATPKDVVGAPSEEAVAVLSDLGVVSGYEDGTYKPENIVTRAEMAVLVIRALGLTDYVTTTAKSSFTDMAGFGWAQGYIAYAESLGFMSGYGDGTVKPGNTVSYDEATSMLVRALGYTTDSLPGSWPANFVVKAKSLGILDDIKSGPAGANRGDVAIMLYQALDQSIGQVNKDGEFKADGTDNMLVRLGAKQEAAKVLTNSNTGNAKINVKPYIGAYAVTYTKNDKIIAVGEVKSDFLTGSMSNGKFKADGVEYTLATGVNVSTSAITTGEAMFVNGADETVKATMNTAMGLTDTYTLAVKLNGKTIDNIYSIAVWKDADKFVFEKGMLDDDSIHTNKFTLDDDKNIDLSSFALVGVDSLKDIAIDNVVYVYTSGSKITKIEVGTETVTGKVTRQSGADWTINGAVYNTAAAITIELGQEGTGLLDINGDIFKWTATTSTSGNYAVVLGKDAGNTLDRARVKLLNKAGEEVTYETKLASDATLTAGGLTVGGIIKYSLNKDGFINELVSVATTPIGSGVTLSDSRALLGSEPVDSNAVVFTVKGSEYDVVKLTDVDTKTALTPAAFAKDGKSKIQVLVVPVENAGGAADTYAVINKVEAAINADDETVQYVTGFAGGKAFTAYTEGNLFTVEDVATSAYAVSVLVVNSDGVVTGVTSGTAVTPTAVAVATYNVGSTVTVQAIDGNLIKMNDTWKAIDPNAAVYQYDSAAKAGEKYSVKTINTIKIGSVAYLYQFDKDSEQYDVVVFFR